MPNDDLKGLLLSRGMMYVALLAALTATTIANYRCHVLARRVEKLEAYLFLQYRYDLHNEFTQRQDDGLQVDS